MLTVAKIVLYIKFIKQQVGFFSWEKYIKGYVFAAVAREQLILYLWDIMGVT